MSKTITVELNERSLSNAVTTFSMYRAGKFTPAVSTAMDRLANEAADVIRRSYETAIAQYVTDYESSIGVDVENGKSGEKFVSDITARSDQIGFIEFGAGVFSDGGHPLAENAPFPVFPGSWSDSPQGAGTWSKWIASGGDPNKYRYNREPKYGMYAATEYIKAHASEYLARELRRISI